jgi:hypothetical protein
VKLNKSSKGIFQLLTAAYGEDCMFPARVFEWHKRYSVGSKSVTDDDRPDRQRKAVIENNKKCEM